MATTTRSEMKLPLDGISGLSKPHRGGDMTWLLIWRGVVAVSATVLMINSWIVFLETTRGATIAAPRAEDRDR
jgi:hypothetical protein